MTLLYLGALVALGLLGGVLWWAGSELRDGYARWRGHWPTWEADRPEVLARLAPIIAARQAEIALAQQARARTAAEAARKPKTRAKLAVVERKEA